MTSSIAPLEGHAAMADRIYEAIKRAIFAVELPQGAPLVERELAARFNVSKSPVRDALQRLVGEGLVTQTAYKGMAVQTFPPDYVDELYALRETLEEMAVREATPRFQATDMSAAHTCLELAMRAIDAGDYPEVARANQEFHLTFSHASGNRPLHEALCGLQDRVRLIMAASWQANPSMRREHAQHLAILEAVARGDGEGAARLMREHIHQSRLTHAGQP